VNEKRKIDWAPSLYQKGFMSGMLLVLLPVVGILYFFVGPEIQSLAAAMTSWGECEAETAERYSAATLLYEFQPGEGLEILGGLFEIRPGEAIAGPSGMAPYGRQVVRWYIPSKVKPVVYDDARGRAYSWYLHDEKKMEGPFVPEVQR